MEKQDIFREGIFCEEIFSELEKEILPEERGVYEHLIYIGSGRYAAWK